MAQHILPRPIFMATILGSRPFNTTTMAGTKIMFQATPSGVQILIPGSKKMRVVEVHKSDLMVTNGVVHSVSHVLSANDGKFLVIKKRVCLSCI